MAYVGRSQMDVLYRNNLKRALGQARFTREVVSQIGRNDPHARGIADELSAEPDSRNRAVAWRTDEDVERISKYGLLRDLYNNDHEKHLRPEWLPTGKSEYIRYNLMRFLTRTLTDFMMGGGVEITTGDERVDEYLVNERNIPYYVYKWATNVSTLGMVGLQVVVDERGVDLVKIDPDVLYPEPEDASDDEFKWISKKINVAPDEVVPTEGNWEFNKHKKGGEQDDGIIFEERHFKGYIEYYLYTVKGNYITQALPPNWYNKDLPPLNEDRLCVVETGIDDFMLQILPNVTFDGKFVSDYEDGIDLQREINSRATQCSRILNIHADPKMVLPEGFRQKDPYTGQSIMRGIRDEVLIMSPEDYEFMPQYLTWQSQLQEAYKQLDISLNMFCTVCSVSSSLITRESSTFPESAAAYRLKMTPTMNYVKSKADDFKRVLKRVIRVFVQKLISEGGVCEAPLTENMIGEQEGQKFLSADKDDVKRSSFSSPADVSVNSIDVRFKPSLPQDERLLIERATSDTPTASIERVLRELDGYSPKEVASELARIAEERRARDESVAIGNDLQFGNGPPELSQGGLNSSGGNHLLSTDTSNLV